MVPDIPVTQRLISGAAEKGRIARRAATLIADGETLLIYGGSTTRAFFGQLGSRPSLTIVTNDLSIPAALTPVTVLPLYLLGGQVLIQSQITIVTVVIPPTAP